MNGLSYSHESKQKVCGTYLSCESSIRVLSSSHPHVAMSYPKPNSSSCFIFGLFFSVRAMSYVLFTCMDPCGFFRHTSFTKKIEKKSGWRRSSRRQTFFLFEFVSQQHNEYTRRHGAVARRTRGRGGRWPWCRSDRRRNRSERPSLGVERNFVGVVFVLRRERSARDFR